MNGLVVHFSFHWRGVATTTQKMGQAAKIKQNFQEMFIEKSRQTRKEAIVTFMNLKIKPTQNIKDHIIKVIKYLN